MKVRAPHFLLFSEANQARCDERGVSDAGGQWRFVLESLDGESKLEAADEEPEVRGERLDLLAVVRGLEALDQPSRVTLVTSSRYVSRGLRHGLELWRENDWQWERFGEMTPVKNDDLWQRIDRALSIHDVDCRMWRFDPPQNVLSRSRHGGDETAGGANDDSGKQTTAGRWLGRFSRRRTSSDGENAGLSE